MTREEKNREVMRLFCTLSNSEFLTEKVLDELAGILEMVVKQEEVARTEAKLAELEPAVVERKRTELQSELSSLTRR